MNIRMEKLYDISVVCMFKNQKPYGKTILLIGFIYGCDFMQAENRAENTQRHFPGLWLFHNREVPAFRTAL